ncbi:MAG: ATP-dependent helicase, partial [Chloroflexi bacterium]|nr:ATP-dependent helicase [Chloroflexota bacterium]
MIDHRGDVLFLPADPPRLGAFALWRPPPQGIGTASAVGVVHPDTGHLRTLSVPARQRPVAVAIPGVAALRGDEPVAPSQLAWSSSFDAA